MNAKFALLALFLFCARISTNAESIKEYYIELDGINSKKIYEQIEELVRSHKEIVRFFMIYPAGEERFCILKTHQSVSKEEFDLWVKEAGVSVRYYREGVYTNEFISAKKIHFKPGVENLPSE